MKKVVISILVVVCLGLGGYYLYNNMNQQNNIVNDAVSSTSNLVEDFKNQVINFGKQVNDLKFVESINYSVDEATKKIDELININQQLENLKTTINNSALVDSVKTSFEDGINQVTSFIQEQINNFKKIINN